MYPTDLIDGHPALLANGVPVGYTVEQGHIKVTDFTLNAARVGEGQAIKLKLTLGESSVELTVPLDSGNGSPYTHRWQENALSQGRKISLSGMPMPDVAQHQEVESDYKPEETYIDALNLDVQHDVTDIFVPVGSDQFSLEVRRSLQQESWTVNSYPLGGQPDKPFGPCWRSNIAPNIHFERRISPGRIDETIVATDFNGQSYRFKNYTEYADTGTNYTHWVEPLSTQSALSMEGVSLDGGEDGNPWVLTLPNGTTCTYSGSPSVNADFYDHEPSSPYPTTHKYYRIVATQDRAGNGLEYRFDGVPTTCIIPSSIRATKTGQELLIKTDAIGLRVQWIKDPRGNYVVYNYQSGPAGVSPPTLDYTCISNGVAVSPPVTAYGYAYTNEYDTREYFELPRDHHHLMVESIEDGNGNTYSFDYVRTERFNYFAAGGTDRTREQFGNPYRLSSVVRPDTGTVFFADNGDRGTERVSTGSSWVDFALNKYPTNTVTDVNGKDWKYIFSDPHLSTPVDKQGSQICVYEYQQLDILAPEGLGSEAYRFERLGDIRLENGMEPLAIVAQTNFSGQVKSYAYDLNISSNKPSAEIDALSHPKYFTYTDSFNDQLKTVTNELGQITCYGFDAYGNRTSETNFSANGQDVLSLSLMEYADATFTNFMTKQIVKRLSSTGEPGWITDMVTEFTPDQYGKVGSKKTYPDGEGQARLTTIYTYDANNNLIAVFDPRDNATVNTYDVFNRLETIAFFEGSNTNAAPKCTKRFWYDKRSNKTWEKDENDHYTYYEYDCFNNLVKTVRVMDYTGFSPPATGLETYSEKSDDIVVSSIYNPDGSLASTTDARGLVTTNVYDSLRRLEMTIVDPDGLAYTNSFAYSTTNNYCGAITMPPYKFMPTSVTDPRGYQTKTLYDALSRPIKTEAQVTNDTFYVLSTTGYDDLGNPLSVTNWVSASSNQVTETLYDGLNRPYMVFNADGTTNGIRYTSTGLQWQTTNELGRVSQVEYDAAGRPVLTRSPSIPLDGGGTTNAITRTGYDANGNTWWVRDADGNTTTNLYDYRNRLVQTIAPAVPDWSDSGNLAHPTVTTVYDNVGNVVSVTDAESNTTTNFYDEANRMFATWAPPVNVYGKTGMIRPGTTNEFDKGGNIRFTHDANGKTVEMQYDILGRLTNTVDAVGNTISFAYDANGNQRYLTDGNTNTTEFVYDGLNRKISTIYPEVDGTNAMERAVYDLLGNRTMRVDCNGVETKYAYDSRNRLDLVTYPGNRTRDYSYDAVGNLTNVVESAEAHANVSYTYDTLNRVKTETSVGITHEYKYDLNGNRTNAVYGISNRETDWQYDALNRITDIVESGTNTTVYRYDLNGKPVYRQYPSGVEESRTYDAMGRLKIMDSNEPDFWLSLIYDYDAVGSARKMYQAAYGVGEETAHNTVEWEYDARYRLTNETITVTGSLDPSTQTTAYSWDGADNRKTKKVELSHYPYVTKDISYTYNALNQLEGYSGFDYEASSPAVDYLYDANGNRTNKTEYVYGSPNSTTTYGYDEDNRLLQVTEGSSVHKFEYDYRSRRYYRSTPTTPNMYCIFDGGLAVQEYEPLYKQFLHPAAYLTAEYLRGPDLGGGVGGMVYSIRNGTRTYSHSNHRGDVIARSDDNGSLTWFAIYEAYGTRPYEWSDGTTGNPDRQMANTKDEEADIGMLNEGMRFRDLETGTFLTRDPIGYGDGPNIYCYVHCNPITHFDALGLETTVARHIYSSHWYSTSYIQYLEPGDDGYVKHFVSKDGTPMVQAREYEKTFWGKSLSDSGMRVRPAEGSELAYFKTDENGATTTQSLSEGAMGNFIRGGAEVQIGPYSDKVQQLGELSTSLAPVPSPTQVTTLGKVLYKGFEGICNSALQQSVENGKVTLKETASGSIQNWIGSALGSAADKGWDYSQTSSTWGAVGTWMVNLGLKEGSDALVEAVADELTGDNQTPIEDTVDEDESDN